MSRGGFRRQSVCALDENLGRDVRLDSSIGLRGCEVSDEAVQTEAHLGLRNARVESRGCIGSGVTLPGGDTVEEGALSNAGSVATKYDSSARLLR